MKTATTATATTSSETPRIYVACLAAYNNGMLHGAWIDATADAWAMWAQVEAMLSRSPMPDAEEHAIHDYEGFAGVRIEEYTDLETVAQITAFLSQHGALGAAVIEHYCGDLDEAREALEERYLGSYASLADYMQDITEEATTIPTMLRYYIDWQAMARDAEMSGDVITIQTGYEQTHVFAAH
jgi:antirestriction protein